MFHYFAQKTSQSQFKDVICRTSFVFIDEPFLRCAYTLKRTPLLLWYSCAIFAGKIHIPKRVCVAVSAVSFRHLEETLTRNHVWGEIAARNEVFERIFMATPKFRTNLRKWPAFCFNADVYYDDEFTRIGSVELVSKLKVFWKWGSGF